MSPLLPSSTFWALRDPTFWPSLRAWPSPLSDSWMSRVREPFSFLTPKAFPHGVQLFIGFEDPSHVPIGSFKFHHYLWFLFLEGRSFLPRTPRFSLWASYHFVFISRRLLDSLLTSQWFHLQEVLPIPCIVESASYPPDDLPLEDSVPVTLAYSLSLHEAWLFFFCGPLGFWWPLHAEVQTPRASCLKLMFWCPETRPRLPSPHHWSFPCLEVPLCDETK